MILSKGLIGFKAVERIEMALYVFFFERREDYDAGIY